MLKKFALIWMACLVFFAFSTPDLVEAKRGGSYKSQRSTFTPGVSKSNTDNISKTETKSTTTTNSGVNTQSNANRGLFGGSGGGFMKGLMVGGLAGLLFGGLFGSLGFLGDMLGLIINVLAIVVLFMLIRKVIAYFMERKKQEPKRYNQ